MVFGASEDASGLPTTEDQRELTRMMQKAWGAFVTDPARGLEGIWPDFGSGEESLIRLGFENSPTPDFVGPEVYDAPCEGLTMGAGDVYDL